MTQVTACVTEPETVTGFTGVNHKAASLVGVEQRLNVCLLLLLRLLLFLFFYCNLLHQLAATNRARERPGSCESMRVPKALHSYAAAGTAALALCPELVTKRFTKNSPPHQEHVYNPCKLSMIQDRFVQFRLLSSNHLTILILILILFRIPLDHHELDRTSCQCTGTGFARCCQLHNHFRSRYQINKPTASICSICGRSVFRSNQACSRPPL